MKEYGRTIEKNEELFFLASITKLPIRIRYDVGWIWVDIQETSGTPFHKPRHIRFSVTSEDAHLLVDAISQLVPRTKPEPGK